MYFLAHMARARLRDRHQQNLKRKLQLLKEEQGMAPVSDPGPSTKTEKPDQPEEPGPSSQQSSPKEQSQEDEISNEESVFRKK